MHSAEARGGAPAPGAPPDPDSLEELVPLVYDELRALARRHRRRSGGADTLDTTGLVHEAYLKLAGASRLQLLGRAQFFGLAARVLRQVLTDRARTRRRLKRGGDHVSLTLDRVEHVLAAGVPDQAETLLALDDALTRLARLDPRQGRVVECRFYAGMSIPETAEALGVSEATVKRDWTAAQAWLFRELQGA
ncbi:MAG TPA: ECF-type sigma factor [Gemmatimonadales bacterium]|nr:ECF-type sigma factor [Gemmatimonadales bacterium]